MQFNFLEGEQIEPKWKDCVYMELAIPLHSYWMPVLGVAFLKALSISISPVRFPSPRIYSTC